MAVSENSLILMTIAPESRSISPLTPSPSREMRGIRLFRAISRRLAKRSQDDFEEDSRSSSTDSSCKGNNSCSSGESGFRSVSPHHMSSSSSETGSDKVGRHPLSTSAESIRKVFQSLSINTRSKSCTNTKENKRKNKKSPPKKILRPPVSYTYVKGLSGLPTQRVPKGTASSRFYNLNSCGNYNIQYMATLHR